MAEYRPQLEHPANPFVQSLGGRNFVRQGTAMSELELQYFDAGKVTSAIGQIHHTIGDADVRDVPGLRYSSPWPWVLGLSIGITMWGFLAWSIWVS
jgi:hypothetical protein